MKEDHHRPAWVRCSIPAASLLWHAIIARAPNTRPQSMKVAAVAGRNLKTLVSVDLLSLLLAPADYLLPPC